MFNEFTPVNAIAERVNVTNVKPPPRRNGKLPIFKTDYTSTGSVKVEKAVPAEIYEPRNLKPLFTSHKERSIPQRLYSYFTKPKNPIHKMIRNETDFDINRLKKICKEIGLDIEQFGISELETLIINYILGSGDVSDFYNRQLILRFCKIRKLIHEKVPDLERTRPYAYLYIYLYHNINDINSVSMLLDNKTELDRINRLPEAKQLYDYFMNENLDSRRISALDAIEHEENYNMLDDPSRFRIPTKRGGRRTRKMKVTKRKSKSKRSKGQIKTKTKHKN